MNTFAYHCNVTKDVHRSLLKFVNHFHPKVTSDIVDACDSPKPKYVYQFVKAFPTCKQSFDTWVASTGLNPSKTWALACKLAITGDPKLRCVVCGHALAYGSVCSYECKRKAVMTPAACNRRRKTLIRKYGVEHQMHNTKIANKVGAKVRETKAKFSSEDWAKVQSKYRDTMTDKYGVDHNSRDPVLRKKYLATLKANYGVTAPLQSDVVKSRYENTCWERYGLRHVMQTVESKRRIIAQNNSYAGYKRYDYTNRLGEVFKLQGRLEPVIASMIEARSWIVRPCKFEIAYSHKGNVRHYFPDFVAERNGKATRVVEVKSDFTFRRNQEQVIAKALAATRWCSKRGLDYVLVMKVGKQTYTCSNPKTKSDFDSLVAGLH